MEEELEEIKKQIVNSPLTKEESKQQFIELTKQWGIKHTFDFDEAWEIGQELRRRKDFREKIQEVEKDLINNPISMVGEELAKTNPVTHSFAHGCYIREIYNPANELIITAIHAQSHPFFLLEGEMSILTHNGIEHLVAPYHSITTPGIKRIIYTHSPCRFVTVHATELTDPDEIEKKVKELQNIAKEDIKLINQLKLKI